MNALIPRSPREFAGFIGCMVLVPLCAVIFVLTVVTGGAK